VRRLAITFAALAGIVALVVAAPALSLRPYRPEPVDFELTGPAAQPGGAGVVALSDSTRSGGPPAFSSRKLRVGKRFNLVGLRWSGASEPELQLRFRRSGEKWSGWLEVGAHSEHGPDAGSGERTRGGTSDPVWVGDGDEVQYRSSERLRAVKLHFVNTRGTATRAERIKTATRRSANKALLAVANVTPAQAQDGRPAIVPRSAWGAEDCKPKSAPQYGQIKAAFVHHTVTANEYTPEEAPSIVLGICRFHRNSNGWNDIGYNFLVDKFGTIYEGRAGGVDRAVIGSQAANNNSDTTGISNLGTHTAVPQTEPALRAIADLLRWKLSLHGVPAQGQVTLGSGRTIERISGHRDVNSTACPGNALYAQLPAIRALVANAGPAPPSTKLELKALTTRVRYPNSTQVVGRLLGPDGAPLAGRTVKVQLRKLGGLSTVARRRTASDGRFSATVKPAGKRGLSARFAGGGGVASTTSPTVTVDVRPKLEARLASSGTRVGGTIVLTGRIGPAKRIVRVVIVRTTGPGSPKQVANLRVRTFKQGHLRGIWHPKKAGKYRVYALSPNDGDTLRAQSPKITLTVAKGSGGASR